MALVLWDGNVGGAEKITAELAAGMRSIGIDASVVFVRDPKTLAADLDRLGVPYRTLGARRVEEVLWRPRTFASMVAALGPDGALLPTVGHLAPALRLGGYRAPLVAMEHGFLLLMETFPFPLRIGRQLERWLAAPFVDAEVVVSAYMLRAVQHLRPARRIELIPNGVDLGRYASESRTQDDRCVIGCASRLIAGKGIVELIQAFAIAVQSAPEARLRIAGHGSQRSRIERMIEELGLTGRVELAGVVADMPAFWRRTDLGVMPSTAKESFGMVALEAMAAARPVVATRNGGAAEVVEEGRTGRLVAPGDVRGLARVLVEYARDPQLRDRHGRAGRARAESEFSMRRCASHYARLFDEMGRQRGRRATSGVDQFGPEQGRSRSDAFHEVSASEAHVG